MGLVIINERYQKHIATEIKHQNKEWKNSKTMQKD
jgi:hypothetical protein